MFYYHLISVAAVLLYLTDVRVHALSCMPCYRISKDGELISPKCEIRSEWCELTYTPCGCCPVCKGKVDQECHGMSAVCEKGLVCVNEEGVEKETVGWWEWDFRGTCQYPSVTTDYPSTTPVVSSSEEVPEFYP